MEEFYNRIKSMRLSLNLTQEELGELLHVSAVSVGHWEKGSKCPSMSAIISLARIFKVSTDYLLGVNTEHSNDCLLFTKDERALLTNYRALDKYGRRAVDTLCAIEKVRVESERISKIIKPNIVELQQAPSRYIPRYSTPSAAGHSVPLDGNDFTMILVDENVPDDADFAVCIQGNSMYPYINDGDVVYVKRDCELSIGDVGIFCVDGAMYCKQYYIDDDKNMILVSANQHLRDTNVYIAADSDTFVKCYGKALLDYRIEIPDYIFED